MQTLSSETPPTEEKPALSRPEFSGPLFERLSFIERLNLRLVRKSFEPGLFNRVLRFFQRRVGQAWIHHSTKNLRHVIGLSRLEGLADGRSILVVANHRSFFDLYVVTAELIRRGMKKRIAFMVRAKFFYDSVFGLVVNFLMSFLSMYPPVFRDRKKLFFNALALDELSWLLAGGGVFSGIHPEGTRKQDDDPYTFLPARPGVGRIILNSNALVVPVFVSGLGNDLVQQIRGNFNGRGQKIVIVFGRPIDFGNLLEQKGTPKLYQEIADRCMAAIGDLAQEEKSFRACGESSS
jgi:1-acyl-sn-glycerol-3-phosphate acyltransferase